MIHLLRNPARLPYPVLGAFLLVLTAPIMALVAIAAPLITTYDPKKQDWGNPLKPPSAEHFFGTDELGRDVYTRVVYGARVSMPVGFLLTGVALLVGVPLGLIAAYYQGYRDVAQARSLVLVDNHVNWLDTVFL